VTAATWRKFLLKSKNGQRTQTQNFEFFKKWATDPKWAQIWGCSFAPPLFEFWARGNCPSTDQTCPYTTWGLWELDEGALGMGYRSLKRLRGRGLGEGSLHRGTWKMRFLRDMQMSRRRGSIFIGALLGKMEGFRLLGLLRDGWRGSGDGVSLSVGALWREPGGGLPSGDP